MQINFPGHTEVRAGISERADGSMVWWNRKPVDKAIRANRDKYFKKIGIKPERVAAGGTAHGTEVVLVDEKNAGQYLLNADALVSNVPNLFLTITAADCLPVFYYNPVSVSFGVAHAGWRGLAKGILENTARALQNVYGAKAEDLLIAIGPHIRACHYEVGREVAILFNQKNIERRNGHLFASLADEAGSRLRGLGVKRISVSSACTYCDTEKFYSARRDKSEPLEGMAAYIGINAKETKEHEKNECEK